MTEVPVSSKVAQNCSSWKDENDEVGRRRYEFCSRYEGYGSVCSCKNPSKIQDLNEKSKPILNNQVLLIFFYVRHCLSLLFISQPGPGAGREKFNEIKSPIWTFYVTQSFLSSGLGFEVWGTPESGARVGGIIIVLRTFPELVGRFVQNLVEVGPAVCV